MPSPDLIHFGIDGGATSSFGVAVDRHGAVLATARAGSLNLLGSDLPTARRSLRHVIKGLQSSLPSGAAFHHGVIGCAALFTDATPAEKRALCAGLLPLATTHVVSDCQTAHFGATLGRPGVVIVAGTGSIVLAKGEDGTFAQRGGWGHLLGDEGGAWWIARESIRAAIAAHEKRAPHSCLDRLVRRFFRISSLHDLAALVHGRLAKEEVAALAAFLARTVPPSDRVFRALLHRAGRELAAPALAAIRAAHLRSRPVPVFLAGSVLTRNRRVRTSLLAALRPRIAVQVLPPALPAVLGAAAMSLATGGIALSSRLVANLRRGYRQAS